MKGIVLQVFLWIAISLLSLGYTEDRADRLMQEIRCPVCEGQSIYDSQTDLAGELRHFVAQGIAQGDSDERIKAELQKKYGDSVLFRPPYKRQTLILWWGPLGFLGLMIGWFFLRRRFSIDVKTP